jgi:beta-1,4-mannosyltransferase
MCRTADEDFGILLEAATMYDRRVAALLGEINADFSDRAVESYFDTGTQNPFPRLLFVITGTNVLQCFEICKDKILS